MADIKFKHRQPVFCPTVGYGMITKIKGDMLTIKFDRNPDGTLKQFPLTLEKDKKEVKKA